MSLEIFNFMHSAALEISGLAGSYIAALSMGLHPITAFPVSPEINSQQTAAIIGADLVGTAISSALLDRATSKEIHFKEILLYLTLRGSIAVTTSLLSRLEYSVKIANFSEALSMVTYVLIKAFKSSKDLKLKRGALCLLPEAFFQTATVEAAAIGLSFGSASFFNFPYKTLFMITSDPTLYNSITLIVSDSVGFALTAILIEMLLDLSRSRRDMLQYQFKPKIYCQECAKGCICRASLGIICLIFPNISSDMVPIDKLANFLEAFSLVILAQPFAKITKLINDLHLPDLHLPTSPSSALPAFIGSRGDNVGI